MMVPFFAFFSHVTLRHGPSLPNAVQEKYARLCTASKCAKLVETPDDMISIHRRHSLPEEVTILMKPLVPRFGDPFLRPCSSPWKIPKSAAFMNISTWLRLMSLHESV